MAINPTPFSPKTTKKKTNPLYLMLGIALFLGLSAAFGIWQFLNKTQKQTKELAKTQSIVVASREIMAGAKLVVEDLTLKEVPVQTIPAGSLNSTDMLVGRITKGSIATNEPLSEIKLVPEGSASGLTGIIPPGQRAITIKVNDIAGVGGFIKPGDRVDILSVWRDEEAYSRIILSNVLIIAVGDQLYDPNMVAEPVAMIVPQVTVALDTINAEKLALAASASQIQLLLRPHGDTEIAESTGTSFTNVYTPTAVKADATVDIAPEVAIPKDTIDIIVGDKRTTYIYY